MFGSVSSAGPNDFDNVLKILELVSDPAKAKAAIAELKKQAKEHKDNHLAAQAVHAAAQKRHAEATELSDRAAERAQFLDRRDAALAERAKTVEAEFAKLAEAQTVFAKEYESRDAKVAATQTYLNERLADVARRETALRNAEDRVDSLEDDLRRRLDLIKTAAA